MTTPEAAESKADCLSGQCEPDCHDHSPAHPLWGRRAARDDAGAAQRRTARTAERRRAARASALAADYLGPVA